MRRIVTATSIVAAGITALAVAATPAMAAGSYGTGDGTGTCPFAGVSTSAGTNAYGQGSGMGMGANAGQGRGMKGNGMGAGMGTNTLPSGTLTADQKADLASMAEEEKMAHDVYVALAAKFPSVVQFSRIARAEATHQAAVQRMLTLYGIADPTTGLAAGEFDSAAFQGLYDSLITANTTAEALAAGVTVEKTDIADLKATMVGVTAPNVLNVYTNLLEGSERHLVAFGG